jgi:hypothetical protein
MKKHLSFANTVALIALFVALGGSAYAAKKLNGKSIKNSSIPAKKLKPGVLKNLDKCPASAPTKVAGLCYSAQQASGVWDGAVQGICPALGLRAPSIAEALTVMNHVGGGPTNVTWTDEVGDLSSPSRVFIKAPGDVVGQIFSTVPGSSHPVRCVINATN